MDQDPIKDFSLPFNDDLSSANYCNKDLANQWSKWRTLINDLIYYLGFIYWDLNSFCVFHELDSLSSPLYCKQVLNVDR